MLMQDYIPAMQVGKYVMCDRANVVYTKWEYSKQECKGAWHAIIYGL
jgi:hypothetical protein